MQNQTSPKSGSKSLTQDQIEEDEIDEDLYGPLLNADKSQFVCIHFKNKSVYYGEVAYIDAEEKVWKLEDIEALEPEQDEEGNDIDPKSKFKRKRHGLGVQINGCTDLDFSSKYEGHWNMGNMHGKGKITYQDKSIYVGNIKNNKRQGQGFFRWHNGCEYEGSWKNDRMEGEGVFTQAETYEKIGGLFKNNYIYMNGQFVNPFLHPSQHKHFFDNLKKIKQMNEANLNENLFVFQRTCDPKQIVHHVHTSNVHNRISIVISSKQKGVNIEQFMQDIQEQTSKKVFQFDLRFCSANLSNKNVLNDYKNQIKNDLSLCLAAGQIFIINMDDSQVEYQEIYDPKIQEFYSANHFPSQIFDYSEIKKPQVYTRVFQGTKFVGREVAKNVSIMVWSKYSVSEYEEDNKVLEKIEHRFQAVLPTSKMDIVLYTRPLGQRSQKNMLSSQNSISQRLKDQQ